LTVENTMMDYVELIKFVRTQYQADDKAVIVFGGSYGGMLAGWLRMKYPATFQGALAASAPLVYFKGAATAPEAEFSNIATQDFASIFPDDQRCSKGIKEGLGYLHDIANGTTRQDDWPAVEQIFDLCSPISKAETVSNLVDHLQNGFLYMAMTDYPYPASFLEPMPAFPVGESCQAFADVKPPSEAELTPEAADGLSDRETLVLTALKAASDTYFNYSG
jgi:pimeloyl-ACP methyl ester carboxylesterase